MGIRPAFILLTIATLCIVVGCRRAATPADPPEATILGFAKAYNEGNTSKMAAFIKGASQGSCKPVGTVTVSDLDSTISGQMAHVDFYTKLIHDGDFASGDEGLDLIAVNGKWLIVAPPENSDQPGILNDLSKKLAYRAHAEEASQPAVCPNKGAIEKRLGLDRAKTFEAVMSAPPDDLKGCPPNGYERFFEGQGSELYWPIGKSDELYIIYHVGQGSGFLTCWKMQNGKPKKTLQVPLCHETWERRLKYDAKNPLINQICRLGIWFKEPPSPELMADIAAIKGLAGYDEDAIAMRFSGCVVLPSKRPNQLVDTFDDDYSQDDAETLEVGFYITPAEARLLWASPNHPHQP